MADASGMAEGTPVRLNGFTIGTLDTIELTGSADPKRSVEFIMKVQEKFLQQIPVDSVAGISAANLLGDKFINITKGRDRADGKGRLRNQEPAGAGHSRTDGADRQPAANLSEAS